MNNHPYYHEIFTTSQKFYHEIFILEQNKRNHESFCHKSLELYGIINKYTEPGYTNGDQTS